MRIVDPGQRFKIQLEAMVRKLLIYLLILVNISGCAFLGARTGHSRQAGSGVYPGVRLESETLRECLEENYGYREMAGVFDDGLEMMFTPFVILDYPATFALDTVCLPLDVILDIHSKSGKERK